MSKLEFLFCGLDASVLSIRTIAITHPSPVNLAGQPQPEQLHLVRKTAQVPLETELLPFQTLRFRRVAPGRDVRCGTSFPLPDHCRHDLDRPEPPGRFPHAQVEQGVIRSLGRHGEGFQREAGAFPVDEISGGSGIQRLKRCSSRPVGVVPHGALRSRSLSIPSSSRTIMAPAGHQSLDSSRAGVSGANAASSSRMSAAE